MSPPLLRPLLSLRPTSGLNSITHDHLFLLPLPRLHQLRFRLASSSAQPGGPPHTTGQSSSVRQRSPRKRTRFPRRRKSIWKHVKEIKPLPKKQILKFEDMDTPMAEAAAKRWNGRRSLYLGSWKDRRDGAFLMHENRGVPFEKTRHPVIDGVLGRETRLVDSYPCVNLDKPRIRHLETLPVLQVEKDLSAINSYLGSAREQLKGVNLRLTEPLPEIIYNQPVKARELVGRANKSLFAEIQSVLSNEDVIVIRAIYGFLIKNNLDRPYMPGLLRVMIRELAAKGEWQLLGHLCVKAMLHKAPRLKDRSVANLVNYVTSLSINSGKGQTEVGQIYRTARRRRGGPEACRLDLREPPSLRYKSIPPVIEFDTEITGKRIEDVTQKKRLTFHGNVYPFIADATIRFRAINGRLDDAIQTMKTMTTMFHVVPHYKSINAILREILRRSNLSSHEPQTQKVPRPSISPISVRRSIREFHTSSVIRARSFATSVELASYPRIPYGPWCLRTSPWKKSFHYDQVKSENTELLDTVIQHLNQNNIHFSTIRLLTKLAKGASQLEIPWTIAQRSKHPKSVIRRAQKDLVEAGYNESLSSPAARHVQLSRGMLLIMRLEAMGIMPSKDSLMVVLRGSVKDGNIPGAKALIDRLQRYGHTLEASEVADIMKQLPSMGLGTLSTPTGEIPSAMSIRTEQVEFITELRRFINHPSYLAPYVLALGRCGSASQIWSTWSIIRSHNLKEGVMTAFVEGFALAKDPDSALQFVREAYRKGYIMNFWQIRAIAGCVERGRPRVGVELMREMIIEGTKVHQELMSGIIRIILKGQGVSLRELNEEQNQLISDVSAEMIEIIDSNRVGKDIGKAMSEIERILSSESE